MQAPRIRSAALSTSARTTTVPSAVAMRPIVLVGAQRIAIRLEAPD